jgi:hypothetical protein
MDIMAESAVKKPSADPPSLPWKSAIFGTRTATASFARYQASSDA